MITPYPASGRQNVSGPWGTTAETFFASEQEHFLGFGNLVQLSHSTLNVGSTSAGMKLHRNMELVDIMLQGAVGFQDSLGGTSNFPAGTVQVVSAGRGIYQQEFNAGVVEAEKIQLGFLPDSLNKPPFKTKAMYDLTEHRDAFVELVSPGNPGSLTVRQRVAVLMGRFTEGQHIGYSLTGTDVGLFVYVISGVVNVQQQTLRRGDAAGLVGEDQVMLHTAEPSTILIVEVSMND